MHIRRFILSSSAVVAVAFFVAGYLTFGRVIDDTVRENARASAATLSEVTFASMFQLMSTGWTHRQAEQYIAAVREAGGGLDTKVQIYRGPVVEKDYGRIDQPPLDGRLQDVLSRGSAITETPEGGVRHLQPLVASGQCLQCHRSAREGDVLGVIEIDQDFAGLVAEARRSLLFWLLALAPLAMAVAAVAVWRVSRRIEHSIAAVDKAAADINAVGDLRHVKFDTLELGFDEFNQLFGSLGQLVHKLQAVAVDKHVLRFQIGLLEKFVITSDIVRDWSEYVVRLLAEINTVVETHVLFSVFQVDEEMFDLEVFWNRPPSDQARAAMENHIRAVVAADSRLSALSHVTLNHHVPHGAENATLELDHRSVVLETKALILDRPKIGGIVGIGVNAAVVQDETLRLVMDSILSTMLNVVGSVKAVYKYTRDMEYYATRDPLTDLYNRRAFSELMEYEAARSGRHGYNFALLVIDIDNFKLVNDGYGHAAGDRYLQAMAKAVAAALRPGDIFARWGGDEFVVLLPEVVPDTAVAVAQRVLETAAAVAVPAGEGRQVTATVSIGLALQPLHAQLPKDLFLFADSMMFRAKEAGKNRVGVPSDEDVAASLREATETTMQVVAAVNEGRIEPFFQPLLDLHSGRIFGFEVLSRLAVEGSHIEAGRFIEFAERAGVIHRLDALVIEKALRAAAVRGYAGYIFVNLSPRALTMADFVATLRRIVAECGMEPARIVFEITERDTIRNVSALETLIAELRQTGCKLAIDDFGSGFSSFQYLRRFPVDFLKIEGDFIANMLSCERDRAFVDTIRRLAANLGIQVIAEHVESAELLDELRGMGIGFAQGYYVGRPGKELGAGLRWPLA